MASSTCVHSQHFKVAPGFYFPPEILKLNFLCLFATFQHQPEKYHPHKQKSKSIMQGKTLQTWIFLSAVHMRSDYHYPQHEPLCRMVVPSFLKIFFLLGGKTRKVFLFDIRSVAFPKGNKCLTVCRVSIFFLPANRRRGLLQCFHIITKIFQNILIISEILHCIVWLCAKRQYSSC